MPRPKNAFRPPTLELVAAQAGVSRATVSRVVNGLDTVDPALAARVRAVIAQVGYSPNLAARSLMTKRTDLIALVAHEPDTRVFGDPFFAGIVRGVSQELSRAKLRMVLVMIQSPDDLDEFNAYLRAGHVDGVLLISEHGSNPISSHAKEAGLPIVMGGRPFDANPDITFVDNDNVGGAEQAARHLASRGRRRIATITGPRDMSAGVDRLEGFRRGLGDRFDETLVEEGDFTLQGGADAARRLLGRCPDVDGIFAASDLMALGSLPVLREAGRSVPGDISVVGFDDIELAAHADPPLTTVRQHTQDQGRLMVRTILALLGRGVQAEGDESPDAAVSVVSPVELVVRQSS